jgi:hypothetical protein
MAGQTLEVRVMKRTGWMGAAAAALLLSGWAIGCEGGGGDGEGGAAGAGAASTTSSGMGGSGVGSGDCDSDADCPGSACVEVTPGGYRVCRVDAPEANQCTNPSLDECCSTVDCASGACHVTPVIPFCGGVMQEPHNVCVADQCADDDVCGAGMICVPAGTLGRKVRACAPAACKLDADCGAEQDGVCAPVTEPCCSFDAGLYCVYPSDGCRSNADCPGGYCEITSEGRTQCAMGAPICPA